MSSKNNQLNNNKRNSNADNSSFYSNFPPLFGQNTIDYNDFNNMKQPFPCNYYNPHINCHCPKCLEFNNMNNNFQLQYNLINKNIELINEQIKLLDMKISMGLITTEAEKNQSLEKNNNFRKNKRNKGYWKKPPNKNNENPQENKDQPEDEDEDEDEQQDPIIFFPPIDIPVNSKNKQSKNEKEKGKFTIHLADILPTSSSEAFNSGLMDSLNLFGPLFSILDGLDPSKIKNDKKKINNNIDNEEIIDDMSEYGSDDEFEELNVEINNIDDLIELGEKIEKIDLEKTKIEEVADILPKDYDNKKVNPKGILMKNGKIKFLNKNGENLENKEESELKKKSIKSEEIVNKDKNGKRTPVNYETLKKLIKPLKKLQAMVGLNSVKNSIVDMILYYSQNFEKNNNNMLHTVIEGSPGVGKTQLGKILAEIYSGLGVIKSSKFKLVKRTDLIGEYLGHTAIKTQKEIDGAEGGVLFIDETHSLGNEDKKDSFSKECIDVLNQNLSENKKNFICIIAGYPDELDKCFFSYNPGLKRRFPFRYRIEGYKPDELTDIFVKKVNDIKWKLNYQEININVLRKFFTENKDQFPFFGGDVDTLLLNCKFAHSRRVFGQHPKNRRKLNKKDIETGFKRFVKNKKNPENNESFKNMFL